MKKTKILSAGLLAVAAGALLAPSAEASNTYTSGDLLIGFELSGNPNDYVIDIGPASNYINASSSFDVTTTLGLGNIASDLSTEFGANWATNYGALSGTNNVQWGIIGQTDPTNGSFGLPKNTLFETNAEITPGTQSAALTEHTSGIQGTIGDNIGGFDSAFDGSAQTANSNYAEFQTASASTSWSSQDPGFAAFGTSYSIEQPSSGNNTGPTNSELDLYELQPHNGQNGTYLGSFTLDSSGDLDFTLSPVSVPEPSTYAAIGLGALFLMLFRRTRKSFLA